MNRLLVIAVAAAMAACTLPAYAQSQPNWGGVTLDWNYSFGKAYCFPGVSPELWIPQGGCDDWTKLSLIFVATSSQGYFMFDVHVNAAPGWYTVAWFDNITVTDLATGQQLLNDPGFESGGTGFFPWAFEGNMQYAPGEGIGGSTAAKTVGVSYGQVAFDKILQYDGWGTGTLQIQAGQTYELAIWCKTAEIPEPGTIVCLLSGLGGLALIRRRSR